MILGLLCGEQPGDLSQATEACPGLSESPGTQEGFISARSSLHWAVCFPRSLLLCVVNTVTDPGSPGTFLPSQASQAA